MNSKCCMGASCSETTFKNNGNEKESFSKNDKSDPGQSQFESKNKYAELGVTDNEECSSEQKLFAGVTPSHGTEWQEAAKKKVNKKTAATETSAVETTKKTYRVMCTEKITVDSGAGESVCPSGWIPLEPVSKTDKLGIKYKAAGGQTLVNQGEKI